MAHGLGTASGESVQGTDQMSQGEGSEVKPELQKDDAVAAQVTVIGMTLLEAVIRREKPYSEMTPKEKASVDACREAYGSDIYMGD